jgi:hypothetical protein
MDWLTLKMFLFSLLIAFIVAKLEIEIEGSDGWAKNLPTWKLHNKWTRVFLGKQPLTGYHLWLVLTIVASLHFPFVLGYPWSLSLEFKMIALFWVAVIAEDFLWFVLNPAFGFKKFNKTYAIWHQEWVGIFPMLYVRLSSLILLLFGLSYLTSK